MYKKITKHGKKRLRERQNIGANSGTLLRSVKLNAKSMYEYQGKFFQYLRSKYDKYNTTVKVHGDNVYIFSRGRKKLITTYPVPEKYLPTSDYKIENRVYTLISALIKLDGCNVQVNLLSGESYLGYIIGNKRNEHTYIKMDIGGGEIIKIWGKDI